VLAGSWAFMEVKMAILDGRHLDVYVLVDQAGSDIVAVDRDRRQFDRSGSSFK
jgi:hypothetical protein